MAQLSGTQPAGARASSAVRYLNGLDTDVDGEPMCLSLGRTIYTVVFEYPGGHATVPVGCGVEYAGGSRLGVDLRTLLGFWDVRPE